MTHSMHMGQRFIWLDALALKDSTLVLTAPPDGKVAPPGPYLLFILCDGVPSNATFMFMADGAPTHVSYSTLNNAQASSTSGSSSTSLLPLASLCKFI